MTRPVFRWLLFTLCLAVFTGAMVWISLRTLDLEDQRCQNEEEAQVQEKLRLALWRMDSLASTLLIRENARPASHYQTFYVPDDLFTPDNDAVPRGEALMPSPLMGSPPDLVLLHFELLKNQPGVCSPQAPEGHNHSRRRAGRARASRHPLDLDLHGHGRGLIAGGGKHDAGGGSGDADADGDPQPG